MRRSKSSFRKHRSTFVLAHDAGGAEIIAAFVRKHSKRMRFTIYAGGPARLVFKRKRISHLPEPRRAVLRSVIARHAGDRALLATGFPHSIELAALKEAKRQGMKTMIYLDSWTNYRERFGYPARGWHRNLPDEIWVGDVHALALARRYFTTTFVRFVPNEYFATVLTRYHTLARAKPLPRDVLYMSAAGRLSERILADFLRACARRKVLYTVRVRLHPDDHRARCKRIIRRFRHRIRIVLSREKDIVHDLLRTRVVVGPETVALVPALMVGIESIRIVPKGEESFLPFPRIRKVRSADAALRTVLRVTKH